MVGVKVNRLGLGFGFGLGFELGLKNFSRQNCGYSVKRKWCHVSLVVRNK